MKQTADQFGWQTLPPGIVLTLFLILTASVGLVGKTSRALGEEIGWRGFLVPELNKVVGFTGVSVISGLMWAAYHFPVLLFADYNKGAPAWYSLLCFTPRRRALIPSLPSSVAATLRGFAVYPAASQLAVFSSPVAHLVLVRS